MTAVASNLKPTMTELIEKEITVSVPASTANLGPGFDTLGLALSLYSKIKFTLLKENDPSIPMISFGNDNSCALTTDKTNLAYRILSELWTDEKEKLERMRLEISTDIPLGRGLGSSSTAILAAACAAHVFSKRPVDKSDLLLESCRYEGHADNLSASLFGGLTISSTHARSGKVVFQKLDWPKDWKTTVIVPTYELSTTKARAVMPKTIAMTDAVSNVQNTAMLVAAIARGDERLAREAMIDTLHEPYRLSLVPELGSLRRHLRNAPIIGIVLSGAGSSVMLVYDRRNEAEIGELLKSWQSAQPEHPAILNLEVDHDGLQSI
ncbi:homoserine kinase [soil metagenome]